MPSYFTAVLRVAREILSEEFFFVEKRQTRQRVVRTAGINVQ
jgi:hypothetical protein